MERLPVEGLVSSSFRREMGLKDDSAPRLRILYESGGLADWGTGILRLSDYTWNPRIIVRSWGGPIVK